MNGSIQTKKRGTAVLGILIVLASLGGALALTGAATAHTCSADTHAGCNGHSCPDDGNVHNHYTEHPWAPDHHCYSEPATGTVDVSFIPLVGDLLENPQE